MKVILPRSRSMTPIRIEAGWLALAAGGLIVLIIGVVALVLPLDAGDVAIGGFGVGLIFLLIGVVVNSYPRLFSIRLFQAAGFFVLAYVVQILLALPIVYRDYSHLSRTTFAAVATVGFLCTLGGIVFTHCLFPISSRRALSWLSAPLCVSPLLRVCIFVLLAICLGVFVLYIRQIGTPPIVQALRGGSTTLELTLAREHSLKLISGRIRYVYGFLRNLLFPYTTLLLLAVAVTFRRWRWRLLFGLSLFACGLLSAATLEKSPVAALLLMLACAWLILRGRPLYLRSMLLLGIAALAFPIFVFFLVYQFDITPVRVANAVVNRLLYTPSEVLLHYIDYFPRMHGFLLGRTLPQVNEIFPAGPFPITFTICHHMHPDWMESCSANGAYLGYLWADFGWLGVILGGFLTGVVLQGLQVLNLRLPKSAPTVALQALLLYQVVMLPSVSLFDNLLSIGLGFVDMVVLTLLLVLVTHRKRVGSR